MQTAVLKNLFPPSIRKQSIFYAIKAIIVVALLYLFGYVAGELHLIAIAVIWVLVSALVSIAFAYPYIIKKLNTKEMFQDYSEASKRINGRFGRLIFCYVLSAFLIATLMIETQKWTTAEWIVVVASIPLYYFISLFINSKIITKQYKPAYQRRGVMLWSQIATGILLTVLFLIIGFLFLYGNSFSLGESFSNTKLLFENSPSQLLAEVGKIGYLIDGFTVYGLSQIGSFDYLLYLTISVVLCLSSSFALSHLLSLCSLEFYDLKKVFLPIEEQNNITLRNKTIIVSVLTLITTSIIFVGLFMYGEQKTSEAQQTNTYTAAQKLIRDQVNLITYEIDGRLYDKDMVEMTIGSLIDQNKNYLETRDFLIQTINNSYSTCNENVDTYLDWFYQPWYEDPFGKIQQGFENLISPNNDRAYQEYKTRLTTDVDYEQFETAINDYNHMLNGLSSQTKDALLGSQLRNIPSWLSTETYSFDEFFQDSQLSTEFPLDAPQGNYTDREAYKAAILQAIEDSHDSLVAKIQ